MTLALSEPQRIGGLTIVIVSDMKTGVLKCAQAPVFMASKRPVFVLAGQGQRVTAFDMSGESVPTAEIASLCPAVLKVFPDMAGTNDNRDQD